MRGAIIGALLGLSLAGCLGEDNDRVAQIQATVKAACGVVPSAADLAAIVVHPGFAGVAAVSRVICEQYNMRQGVVSLVGDNCIAIVNDICIREETDERE